MKTPMIYLNDLPMPPTSNHMYKLFRRGKKTYHVPSNDLKLFQNQMNRYPLSRPYIKGYREIIEHWRNLKLQLQIHCTFYFKRERLYTKDGRFKKLDVSNRLKAAHDCVSKMLGMDDSAFFKVSALKVDAACEGEEMFSAEISTL